MLKIVKAELAAEIPGYNFSRITRIKSRCVIVSYQTLPRRAFGAAARRAAIHGGSVKGAR